MLFVSVRNGGKSQMAAGAQAKGGQARVEVLSASTHRIDMRDPPSALVEPDILSSVDLVITLGREAVVDAQPRIRRHDRRPFNGAPPLE